MTRERSTWNINNIAKQAGLKLADPYTMNQDHVRQQPAADAYVTGDPSTFAEDIHPAAGTWEAEYSGGQVKRNEIGMPEMRNDTFNHSEKTASEEVLVKKAAVCVALARSVLPKTASPMDIEEQSISFMHLPDEELMSTFTRLAAKQDQQQQQQQQVQAAKQDQQDQQGQQQQVQAAQQDQQGQQGQQDQKQAAKQDQQDQQQGQQQQVQAAKQDQQQQQQQQVQAAQNFTDPRHTSVRALLAQDQQGQQGQQDQGQQEQKQAGQEQQAQMQQQLAQMIQQAQQQLDQLQAAQQQQQAGQQQQQAGQQQQQQAGQQQQQAGQQQQQAQMQQQSQAQQVAQAVQQAIQQGQDPVAAAQQCMAQYQQQQQQQAGQQQQGNDGELIDQMLAQQQTQQPMANMDIELDTPTMDVGEVQLGPEDDMLMQLFANEEAQQAQQAQDGGQQQQKQAHAVRTASMRTVGTVPSQGVSRIGGTSAASTGGGSTNLSSLWISAPDVRGAFGIPTNQ